MAFITQAATVLQTLVIAFGAGLAVWGVVNLMEGYSDNNPVAKSQGIKQIMAGGMMYCTSRSLPRMYVLQNSIRMGGLK